MENLEKELYLADMNLIYSIKNRMAHIEGSMLHEEDGYLIFSIGVDNLDGHLNGGICLDDTKVEEFLEKIDSVFSKLKRSYAVWVRTHGNKNLEKVLRDKGLEPIREPGSACMICKNKIDKVKIPDGFKLRVVETKDQVEDLAKVTMKAFDKDKDITKIMFNLRMMCNPKAKAIVIYDRKTEEPVSAATIVTSDGISGIYWVGTIDDYRGQGLGAYVAQEATNIGFKEGSDMVILQASEAGERVYKKLGYETVSHYRSYRVNL